MKRMTIVFATTLVVGSLSLHAFADKPFRYESVGRYQMAVGSDGTVFVLDTATGQCWSRVSRGNWRDEGNPAGLEKPEELERDKPLKLVLPADKVELTIKQRHVKAIPGSDDRVLVWLDDITGGQVLLTIRSQDGEVLLDQVSAEQGDIVKFRIGEATFYCRIKSLKNFAIGDDIGIIEIASDIEALQVKEKPEQRDEAKEKGD